MVAGVALLTTCLGARAPSPAAAGRCLKGVMLAGVITATPTQTTDITIWRR